MEEVNFEEQLLKLSNNFHVDNSINKEIYDQLEYFYSINSRHEYFRISQLVFNQGDETNEVMELNLLYIIELAETNQSLFIKNYKKLYDHLRLGITQKKYIEDHLNRITNEHVAAKNEIQSAISEATAAISNIGLQADNQSEKLNEIEKHSRKITSDFVSILGIFSSVIFAAFGGLEILKNILGNIEKVQTGKLLVFSSITIGAIIFLVFLLLNGLSKLTGLKLRSCNCDSNESCSCNLVQKHPSIVIIYMIILFIFMIGVTEYFLDYRTLINDLINTWKSWIKLLIVFLLSLLFIISSTIWFRKKSDA
ncbi:hypothetical protein [Bacillus benzoevorans]|uniref:Uncharacterized protein n=1 Tax=Bacillus benzoevorans TaxID=1456 RepID=A0A7X0HT99_9BACI|nr:hypothetical protein [Bacillus benzoevorans]MBB6446437.1 hypothetical protein [Bacillus benzoevorans]